MLKIGGIIKRVFIMKTITLILLSIILGATAMFFWREKELRPIINLSECMESRMDYIDGFPYVSLSDMGKCYEQYFNYEGDPNPN